jgi:hypothetical protein
MRRDMLNHRVINGHTAIRLVLEPTTHARLACLWPVLRRLLLRFGVDLKCILLAHGESLMLKGIMANTLSLVMDIFF